jgi:hypothetical protein
MRSTISYSARGISFDGNLVRPLERDSVRSPERDFRSLANEISFARSNEIFVRSRTRFRSSEVHTKISFEREFARRDRCNFRARYLRTLRTIASPTWGTRWCWYRAPVSVTRSSFSRQFTDFQNQTIIVLNESLRTNLSTVTLGQYQQVKPY